MSIPEEYRCFVGGLSWNINDRSLEDAFSEIGKVLEAKVMLDRDTGHSRGFGFVTFADQESLDEAIDRFHNKELDGRIISVNVAKPKVEGDGGDRGYGNDNGHSRGRGSDCFKCGRPGHWARDCSSTSRDRYAGSREYRRSESHRSRDDYSIKSGRSRHTDYDDHNPRHRDRYHRDEKRDYRDQDTRHGGARNGGGSYREKLGPYHRPSDRKERRSSYDDRKERRSSYDRP